MDVIGVGAAKREQMPFALLSGVQQVVLELAPLVARDGGVDQIVPFAPELDSIGAQQRVRDSLQRRGQQAGCRGGSAIGGDWGDNE